jgi:drug/metabolite transporter (DMT)-like permease
LKQHIFDLYGQIRQTIQPLHPKNQSERTKAFLALGVVSFFWGTTWLASKIGVRHMPGLQLAGIRQLLGGGIYTLFFMLQGYTWPSRKQLVQFVWMSILMFVISNGFSTWSLQYIPSGLGAVIGAMAPLWIALFSVLFFRETRLSLTTILGLILGFGGIVIIFSDYLEALFQWSFLLGVLLGIIATMTWALGTLYTVQHAKDLNAYYSLGWQMLLSGVILTAVAWLSGDAIPLSETTAETWYSIAYLVSIGSIITFAAFIYCLKRLPPAQSSVYAYINPIVAVVIGAILNHEKLNLIIAIGTAVTILGVYLVNSGFKKSIAEKEGKV